MGHNDVVGKREYNGGTHFIYALWVYGRVRLSRADLVPEGDKGAPCLVLKGEAWEVTTLQHLRF